MDSTQAGVADESGPLSDSARPNSLGVPADVGKRPTPNPDPESPPPPTRVLPLRGPRVGLGAVLRYVRAEIAAGRGFPETARGARHFNWLESSWRDAMARLDRAGMIRKVGTESDPPRRSIFEVTSLGAAPDRKWCRACVRNLPAAEFWTSSYTADGLSGICRKCTMRNAQRGRGDRSARAARVAAP